MSFFVGKSEFEESIFKRPFGSKRVLWENSLKVMASEKEKSFIMIKQICK